MEKHLKIERKWMKTRTLTLLSRVFVKISTESIGTFDDVNINKNTSCVILKIYPFDEKEFTRLFCHLVRLSEVFHQYSGIKSYTTKNYHFPNSFVKEPFVNVVVFQTKIS